MPYTQRFTLKTPAPVSSVSLANDRLAVGSDDGSVRFYELPSTRVIKAIRGLGGDVASVIWGKKSSSSPESEDLDVWLSSGTTAYKFALDTPKLIIGKEDASAEVLLGQDADDVLNELSISENKKYLGFSTDAGTVGVVELANQHITRTKASHTNICSSVKFIPDRPSEIVSGGYDSALLHFDFKQGNISSRFDIASAPPTTGLSMSPPFVLSLSVSQTGLVAATTADGRVWLGTGADKASPTEKKRSRKWEGLRESNGFFTEVADGPIVASAFVGAATLFTCTLLGKISQHAVTYDEVGHSRLDTLWSSAPADVAKVNTMDVSRQWLIVGGFSEDGKGVVEVWRGSGDVDSPER